MPTDTRFSQNDESKLEPLTMSLRTLVLALLAGALKHSDLTFEEELEPLKIYAQWYETQVQHHDIHVIINDYLQEINVDDVNIMAVGTELQCHIFELLTLALAMLAQEQAWLGRVLSFVQSPVGDSHISLGLLQKILAPCLNTGVKTLGHSHAQQQILEILLSGNALKSGLLVIDSSEKLAPERCLRIEENIFLSLLGAEVHWPSAAAWPKGELILPHKIERDCERYARILSDGNTVLVVKGAVREGKEIAKRIAGLLDREAILIQRFENVDRKFGLFCTIRQALPVFVVTIDTDAQWQLPNLLPYTGPVIVIPTGQGNVNAQDYLVHPWHVALPNKHERVALWQQHIDASDKKTNENLIETLAEHLYSPSRICALAKSAKVEQQLADDESLSLVHIYKASWNNDSGDLGKLAQGVNYEVEDDALVVSERTQKELDFLLQRIKQRESLCENLGVAALARYRLGIKSLFHGPPGTGKTMAASWLANKIHLPLYRVDMASISSKYIGETEKNLASLLAAAEQQEVILLFDEADTLFGKRTDVKDSSDRFANAQTNYLLQRIEEYQGIVILTTNHRNRLDDAFSRRLDMSVEFPSPGPEQRKLLWLRHLAIHDIANADLNRLAVTVDLSGGHIRNAVLSAAVLATGADRKINLIDIIEGLELEYRKLGKRMPSDLMALVKQHSEARGG